MSYVYQPYPKWITRPDGSKCIVNDAQEHELIMTGKLPETGESQLNRIRAFLGLSETDNAADYVIGLLEKPPEETPRRARKNVDHNA